MLRYIILSVLAIFVVLSYIVSPLVFKNIPVEKLWGGITNHGLRQLYIASILLSAVAFLLLFAYLCHTRDIERWFGPMVGFLVSSALWMPFMFLSIRYSFSVVFKILVIFVLFAVAAFAGWMAFRSIGLRSQGAFAVTALVSAWYLFFHTFVLDGIVFSVMFLFKK